MKNMGKQIKDVGVLLIVVGIGSLLLALFPLFSSNMQSPLYMIADRYFIVLLISGLVSALLGIILKEIGTKNNKHKKG